MWVFVAARSLRSRDTTETLRRLCARPTGRSVPLPDALYAVRRAGRLLGANCLTQSIALTAALARAGVNPKLVLGCRRYDAQNWGAHAWVIVGDEMFDPLPSGPHAALAELSAAGDWVPAPSSPAPRTL